MDEQALDRARELCNGFVGLRIGRTRVQQETFLLDVGDPNYELRRCERRLLVDGGLWRLDTGNAIVATNFTSSVVEMEETAAGLVGEVVTAVSLRDHNMLVIEGANWKLIVLPVHPEVENWVLWDETDIRVYCDSDGIIKTENIG